MVDDMREPLALKLDALTLAEEFAGFVVGTRVRIASLDKKAELNGKLGTVRGFYGDRVQVYVESIREAVALKAETLAVADEAPSSPGGADDGSRQVRVECNGVMLKLTLSAKQMSRPFADAVLKPFLKAYSRKKGGDEVTVADVAQVTVDSEGQTSLQVLTDIHIFPVEQCLKNLEGDIDIDVHLKTEKVVAPKPKPKGPERMPRDTRVVVHALTSQTGKALNGQQGLLSGFHEDSGRYDVTLDDGKVVSLKPDNLIDIGAHSL